MERERRAIIIRRFRALPRDLCFTVAEGLDKINLIGDTLSLFRDYYTDCSTMEFIVQNVLQ